jgi:hypothetical protein
MAIRGIRRLGISFYKWLRDSDLCPDARLGTQGVIQMTVTCSTKYVSGWFNETFDLHFNYPYCMEKW